MYVSYLSHSPPTPLISKEKRRLMRNIIKLFYSHTDTASNNAHSNDMKVRGQDTHPPQSRYQQQPHWPALPSDISVIFRSMTGAPLSALSCLVSLPELRWWNRKIRKNWCHGVSPSSHINTVFYSSLCWLTDWHCLGNMCHTKPC